MARQVVSQRIGEILMGFGSVTPQQVEIALQRQTEEGGLLGEIMVKLGFVTEEQVAMALAVQYGIPYSPLDGDAVSCERGVTNLVPDYLARRYCLIPIRRVGEVLTIAMADPCNILAVEDLKILTGCEVQVIISTPSDIRQAIATHYGTPQAGP